MGGDQAEGGDLRPRKLAEAVEGLDAVEAFEPRFRRRRLGERLGHGLDHPADHLQRRRSGLVGEQAVGDENLRRRQRGEDGGKIAGRADEAFDLAGGELDRGHCGGPGAGGDGGQAIGAARVEEAVLGQRPRGDDAHHLAPDDGFGAALPGLGGVFHLLADGDLGARADQFGKIGLGRVHGHAAHGDRRSAMAAAMGERDAEDGGGAGRVLEEELVEVAHAEEDEGVRLDRFRLEILRHHRRGAGGVGYGGGGRGVGVHEGGDATALRRPR
jgi:hypothetical protein